MRKEWFRTIKAEALDRFLYNLCARGYSVRVEVLSNRTVRVFYH